MYCGIDFVCIYSGIKTVGLLGNFSNSRSFAQHLRRFKDVFIFPRDDSYGGRIGAHVTLHPMLGKPEDRTGAVGDVVKCLGEELIPGIRNEVLIVIKRRTDSLMLFFLCVPSECVLEYQI